ncbi:hypothetical protein NA57DRAFT_79622 [Rhizodiscina lignyota]|uniref:Rhodopsin domain-containing protein n=1 Tax=Rhizodiscina lignyota TaxID=1504668 RepID=A0A9P4I8J5_9PEZI|nr:hypothetical protein NA57DRAFT_79622 [Rhizodiscina lignyota]
MSGTYAPLDPLSSDNQGPANVIVAYFLICTTVAFAIVRFAVGRQRLLALDVDDACFTASVIFGILTSVVSHLEVTAGLGKHQKTLSGHDVQKYFKLSYTDQFLAITAMALAKSSILLLFRRLMSQSRLITAFFALSASVIVYFVFSVFATAFQCGLPRPWLLEPTTCTSHGRLQYAIIGMNMITDMLLAIWIIPSLWKLQMDKNTRTIVIALFAARLAVVGVAVGQIVLTQRSLRSADQTWSALPRAIIDQVVVHTSIIHATLPRIHSFLANLQTGMLSTRITTTNIPLTSSKNMSNKPRFTTNINAIDRTKRGTKLSLSSITGKMRRINNQLYVSSSSNDYPLEEKNDSTKEEDGNVINGMRLRPDIMPGSKWSTTIYADPVPPDSRPPHQRSRQHSASTRDERETPMGGRVDEEASTSSLTEGHSRGNGHETDGPRAPPGQDQSQQIWKTKEFRMQIERVRGDGTKLDITKAENRNTGSGS